MMSLSLLIAASVSSASAQISLHMSDRPVAEVIKQIEKSTSYRFFYNSNLDGMRKNVNVSAETRTLTR